MKVTGAIRDFSLDYKTGKAFLTLSINEKKAAMNLYDELNTVEKLSIDIDRYREKRSLDANAYCFVLIDKLAEKLGWTKEEIYRKAIKEIGGVSETVCVLNEAVDRLCAGWHKNGLGWQTDTFPSKIEGCTNVVLYYGSSTYDSKQMYSLIQNIKAECDEQGIPTKTPKEIAAMIELWKAHEQR